MGRWGGKVKGLPHTKGLQAMLYDLPASTAGEKSGGRPPTVLVATGAKHPSPSRDLSEEEEEERSREQHRSLKGWEARLGM